MRALKGRWPVLLPLVLALLGPGARYATAAPAPAPPAPAVIERAASPDDRVALSFDLTWGDEEFRRITAVLDARGVRATFFVGGGWVANHPQDLQRLAAAGHEVGTLGLRIVDPAAVPPGQLSAQLMYAQTMLEQVLGRPVRLFRPPLGSRPGEAVLAAARSASLLTVTYSLDSRDQQLQGTKLVREVVRRARRGDIIRLSASDFTPATAEALPAIIDGLRGRGFKVVTISELLPEPA